MAWRISAANALGEADAEIGALPELISFLNNERAGPLNDGIDNQRGTWPSIYPEALLRSGLHHATKLRREVIYISLAAFDDGAL